jgi:hypothetical protein
MSTEEIKVCRCDYCGRILGKEDDYVNMYGGDDNWIHFARMKNGINVKETANYELDFCNAEHAAEFIIHELMDEPEKVRL